MSQLNYYIIRKEDENLIINMKTNFFKKLIFNDDIRVSRTEKTISLTISNLLNSLLSLLLSMVATRVLSKTDLAITNQTLLAYTTFSPFLSLGLTTGLYYCLSQNESRKRAVAYECLVLVLFTSTIFGLFILLGGNFLLADIFKNQQISSTLYWMIPYTMFLVPSTIFSCILVYENRIKFNSYFNIAKGIVLVIVVVACLLFYKTPSSMIASRVLVTIFFSSILIAYTLLIVLPRDDAKLKWASIKMLIRISVPLGISSMLGTISIQLDKWIISIMLNPEVYAVYEQGARELPLIGTITGAISTVMIVELTKAAKAGDFKTATALFNKVARKTSTLLMPIMVFCFVAAEPLIKVLYTSAYIDAVPTFLIYLLYMPIRVVYYYPMLIALGKSRFVMIKTVVSLLANALISLVLVKIIGMNGAAIGTILTTYFLNVPLNVYVISKATKTKWSELLPFKNIATSIVLSLPGALVCMMISYLVGNVLSSFAHLVIELLLFCVITGLIFMAYNKQTPKKLINTVLRKIRKPR